ncbi:hypothetical protein MD484_g5730, partial [Candolleomyces efflorescens]
MDSFTTISFTAPTVSVPKDAEGGSGSKSGGYCVVFAKESIPTDSEASANQKSGGYCTIA